MRKMFDTRSRAWRDAGLARQLSARAVKRARIQTLVLLPMIAGVLVLYSHRRGLFGVDVPFRVSDRVRLQGGGLAGNIEGVVSSPGLLYTIFSDGEDQIMVPNHVVLSVAVIPLRESSGVDLRARLRPGATPLDIQALLEETVDVPLRDTPRVALEEIDGEEVVVRIHATPAHPADGARLSSEVLRALAAETRRTEAA